MIAYKKKKVPVFLNWSDIDKMKLIQLIIELYNSYFKNNCMITNIFYFFVFVFFLYLWKFSLFFILFFWSIVD